MRYLLTSVLFIFFQSCGLILMSVQGAKLNMKRQDSLEILNLSKKYNIPEGHEIFQLSPGYYHWLHSDSMTLKNDALNSIKNHTQELDYAVYKGESLCGYYYACLGEMTPFLINTNWNASGELDNFPPADYRYFIFIEKKDSLKNKNAYIKTYLNYKPDSLLTLNRYLSFMKPLRSTKSVVAYDYTVIIQWDRLLGRQTKRFIKAVLKNMQKAPDPRKLRVIWCYNENASMVYDLDKATQRKNP